MHRWKKIKIKSIFFVLDEFFCLFYKKNPLKLEMLHDVYEINLELCIAFQFPRVYTYLLRDRVFFILCSLFSPSYTCFFSCVTFVAMLDTEHCVLFDLHVRDRIEYIKKTVKKETSNE